MHPPAAAVVLAVLPLHQTLHQSKKTHEEFQHRLVTASFWEFEMYPFYLSTVL
jgi:hypothetical protein